MKLRKTVVRLLAAVALATSVAAAAPVGLAGHAGPGHLYAGGANGGTSGPFTGVAARACSICAPGPGPGRPGRQ